MWSWKVNIFVRLFVCLFVVVLLLFSLHWFYYTNVHKPRSALFFSSRWRDGDVVDDKLINKKVEAKLKYGTVIIGGRHHKHEAFSGKY